MELLQLMVDELIGLLIIIELLKVVAFFRKEDRNISSLSMFILPQRDLQIVQTIESMNVESHLMLCTFMLPLLVNMKSQQ